MRSVFTEEVARSTEWMMKNAPESTTRRDVKAKLQNTKPQSSLKTLPGSRARQSALTFWSGCLAPFPSQPTLKRKYIQKGKNKARGSQVTSHVVFIFARRTIHARFNSKCTARHLSAIVRCLL